jgi:hypothetical protein
VTDDQAVPPPAAAITAQTVAEINAMLVAGAASWGRCSATSEAPGSPRPLAALGNPYDGGFEVQVEKQGAFRVRGLFGQVATLQVIGGVPVVVLSTGASEEAQAANIQAIISNPGASGR